MCLLKAYVGIPAVLALPSPTRVRLHPVRHRALASHFQEKEANIFVREKLREAFHSDPSNSNDRCVSPRHILKSKKILNAFYERLPIRQRSRFHTHFAKLFKNRDNGHISRGEWFVNFAKKLYAYLLTTNKF